MPAYSKYRSHLHHILLIDERLRRGGFPSSKTIARELELCDRTIRRNIEFMRDVLGAPIEYDPARKGYHYTQPAWSLPGILLTEGELLGLVIVQVAVSAYKGTPLEAYLKGIVDKLAARLPQEISVDPRGLADAFRITLGPLAPIEPKHWELLARAIRQKRSIVMTYYTIGRDETTRREVDPYVLRCFRGDWYLIAHDHLRDAVRIFSLARIRHLEPLARPFTPDPDFDADEYLGAIFEVSETSEHHRVRIQFFDIAARLIAERIWHPTQKLTHNPDGSVILQMTVSDLREVAWWTLSWGRNARVLAPPDLGAVVADEARGIIRMQERHRDSQ